MRTVDVSSKFETLRISRAYGRIKLKEETLKAIKENRIPKGNLVEATRLTGIYASKRTGEILPFCHPIPVDYVAVEVKLGKDRVEVFSEVRGIARTGYEMEALTAVSVALLNVYDMCKGMDDTMVIEEIKLLEKRGGKSDWRRGIEDLTVSVEAEDEELRDLILDLMKDMGVKVSEDSPLVIKVKGGEREDTAGIMEAVIAFFDFRKDPARLRDPVRIYREGERTVILLPNSKERIEDFLRSSGAVVFHILR